MSYLIYPMEKHSNVRTIDSPNGRVVVYRTPLFFDEYPATSTLDQAVRNRMMELGFNQVQFAQYVRLSQSEVSIILSRKLRDYQLTTINKLGVALNMDISQVAELVVMVKSKEDEEINKTLEEVIEEVRAQPEDVKRVAVGVMRGILIDDARPDIVIAGYYGGVKQALPDLPDYRIVSFDPLGYDRTSVARMVFSNPRVRTITFYDDWTNTNKLALVRKISNSLIETKNK